MIQTPFWVLFFGVVAIVMVAFVVVAAIVVRGGIPGDGRENYSEAPLGILVRLRIHQPSCCLTRSRARTKAPCVGLNLARNPLR